MQVLPVNDTCVYNMWWDSYPYSSVSVHALHPQYVALRATLDDLPGHQMPTDIAAEIEAARVSSTFLDLYYHMFSCISRYTRGIQLIVLCSKRANSTPTQGRSIVKLQ